MIRLTNYAKTRAHANDTRDFRALETRTFRLLYGIPRSSSRARALDAYMLSPILQTYQQRSRRRRHANVYTLRSASRARARTTKARHHTAPHRTKLHTGSGITAHRRPVIVVSARYLNSYFLSKWPGRGVCAMRLHSSASHPQPHRIFASGNRMWVCVCVCL